MQNQHLRDAVIDNDIDALAKLLSQGVDVNTQITFGRTVLHEACIKNNRAMAKLAIYYNADANAVDVNGRTPLHFAARYSNFDLIQLLLCHVNSIDVRDEHGNTPLCDAVYVCNADDRNSINKVQQLLDAGADPDKLNKYGQSPRGLASIIYPPVVKFERNNNRWIVRGCSG